jgi:predicted metal-dependent phosphoesterase TrpH
LHAAHGLSITVVPGVELSVEDDGGRFHLLGYNFNPYDRELKDALAHLRQSRAERNALMAQRMAVLGLPLTMDDVRAEAGPDSQVVARPHFAQALLKRGLAASVQDAFDRYLATGKPLYLPKQVLTPHDAIALIHNAGGVAVMAHPGLVPLGDDALAARIAHLAAQSGMDGIEAFYSQHTQAQTDRFLQIAKQNHLIVTGGSDFHGTPKPHVPLGIVYRGKPAPASLLDALHARQTAL